MNTFIREAITDKLMMLNEEKESLDSSIDEYKAKLVKMEKLQSEYELIIAQTVEFLKVKPSVKAARSKKR